MNNKNKIFVCTLLLFVILISLSFVSAWTRSSVSYTQSLGRGYFGDYNAFRQEACREGLGQDFVIQVAPLGCTPAVVRSDLLEDQDYPVYCQLLATKINPLIDVKAIYNIDFQGQRPKGVRDIAFLPSSAALGRRPEALNSPMLSNIGYVAIVLEKQKNESSMPDFIQGNLSARLIYNIENAFGIGRATFYLPEIPDNKWEDRKIAYSFWRGKGTLRADTIYDNRALIAVYAGDRKILSVDLREGQESDLIYLPGFDCLAGLRLTLNDLEVPATRARLNINGEIFELKDREEFFDGACQVRDLRKQGLIEKVKIKCGSSDEFPLSVTPKVKLAINGDEEEKEIGDFLYKTEDEKKFVYLGFVGKRRFDQRDEEFYAYLVAIPQQLGKLGEAELEGIAAHDRNMNAKSEGSMTALTNALNKVSGKIIEGFKFVVKGEDIELLTQSGEEKEIFGGRVSILGVADAINGDLSEGARANYDKAIQDYDTIISSFSETSYPNGAENTKGEEAFAEKIKLANKLEMKKDVVSFCRDFKNKYPNSEKLKELSEYCDNQIRLASISSSSAYISVNGDAKEFSFEGIYEPGSEEYGVNITLSNAGEIYSGSFGVRKNGVVYLSDNESIYLKELYDNYAVFGINHVDGNSGQIRIEKNKALTFGNKKYSLSVDKINLRKVAKVSIRPDIRHTESKTNFSFRIGIEKRGIKLSPDEIRKRLELLNKTIAEWQERNERLSKIVKGMKTACLGTGAVLAIKNLLANKDGKSIARQQVMRGEGGWYEICTNLVKENKAEYPTIDKCLFKKSAEIEKDVNAYYERLRNLNDEIKQLEESCQTTGFLGSRVVNDSCFSIKYVNRLKQNNFRDRLKAKYPSGVVNVQGKEIDIDEFVDGLDSSQTSIEDLRELDLYSRIDGEQTLDGMISERLTTQVKDVYDDTADDIERTTLAQKYGVEEVITAGDEELRTFVLTKDQTFADVKGKFAESMGPYNIEDKNYIVIYKDLTGGKEYLIQLNDDRSVSQTYEIQGSSLVIPNKDEINPFNLNFQKVDAGTYQNPYKISYNENKVVLRYYEAGPYAGKPALVPFDQKNGWYVYVTSYEDSGRPRNFYVCNVGSDGIEQNMKGDDICRGVNTVSGEPYNVFPGLEEREAASLIRKAAGDNGAIEQALRQYGSRRVSIFNWQIDVGSPSVDIPDVQCQDVMSPQECRLLFNVCDPVICPSSRCDLGGAYPVKDVVQSGIIGSVALCLPNFPEVYIPVCLSGINAGIEGWISIQKAYQQCLQQNLATGQTIGICDEIYSLYKCEFLSRQAVPLVKAGTQKILEVITGQNVRGGGEYLGVQSAMQNADKSMKFFTQYYAENSFKAFKARSTEEVGSEICKMYVSAKYPSSATLLDQLTEPDSPSQFYARFDEIPYTTATNPPISHYKVFYHIYAGKDRGAYYRVYLKGSAASSYYQDTSSPYVVASGYIPKGDFATQTPDFTAPSGYKELCVVVNEQTECGFKEVSTSFAVNYIRDKYIAEQVKKSNIKTEEECKSGSASLYSLINPNLQEGASETLNPSVYNRGMTRICATACPSKNTDDCDGQNSAWLDVGYCDDPKMRCWLNRENVEDIIKNANIEADALKEQDERTQKILIEGKDYAADDAEFEKELEKLPAGTDISLISQRISVISEIFNRVFYNRHKAHLHLLRGKDYSSLAQELYKKYLEGKKPSQGETPGTGEVYGPPTPEEAAAAVQDEVETISDLTDIENLPLEQQEKIIEQLTEMYPVFRIESSDGLLGTGFAASLPFYLQYSSNAGKWFWSLDKDAYWVDASKTVYEGGPNAPKTNYDLRSPSKENQEFIKTLNGVDYADYAEGIKRIIIKVINDEDDLITGRVEFKDGVFKIEIDEKTISAVFIDNKWRLLGGVGRYYYDSATNSFVYDESFRDLSGLSFEDRANFDRIVSSERLSLSTEGNLNLFKSLIGQDFYDGARIIFNTNFVDTIKELEEELEITPSEGPQLPSPEPTSLNTINSQFFKDRVLQYLDIISRASQKYSVPESLIVAIIAKESSGDARAVGDGGDSAGLMQISQAAADSAGMGSQYSGSKFNPSYNIEVGTAYYKWLENRYSLYNSGSDLKKITLAGYNWGIGFVEGSQSRNIQAACPDKKWVNCKNIPIGVLQHIANILAMEREWEENQGTSSTPPSGPQD